MSSEKGQKHIYDQEHQLYYYYNNFKGHSQKETKSTVISRRRLFFAYSTVTMYNKLKTW